MLSPRTSITAAPWLRASSTVRSVEPPSATMTSSAQRGARAAVRAHRVAVAPAERQVHGVERAGDDGPHLRSDRDDVQQLGRHRQTALIDVDEGLALRDAHDWVPRPATEVVVQARLEPRPLWEVWHIRDSGCPPGARCTYRERSGWKSSDRSRSGAVTVRRHSSCRSSRKW